MNASNVPVRKVRWLHVINSLDPASGGPVAGLTTLAQHAVDREIEFHVATLDLPDTPYARRFPVPVMALGENSWLRRLAPSFFHSGKLIPWLTKHASDYDCVVINGAWGFNALAVWRALQGSQTPYVLFTHGMLDPWFKRAYPLKHVKKQIYWSLLLGRILRGARVVLFTSQEEMMSSRGVYFGFSGYREQVIAYGPNDVPPASEAQKSAFLAAVPSVGDRPFLLYLSRIHPKKGCDLLIEAFCRIARSDEDIQLVMAGPDPDCLRGSLMRGPEAQGLAGRIHWPGMLTGDAKWGAFRAAAAFVLPSHQENFGIAVAEALACGTPVLISDKVNIWREIADSRAGLVCTDDLPGATQLIERFLRMSAEDREMMRHSARKCFLDNFCGDRFAQDMLRLVSSLHDGVR
jgi:glycosyltransferase involved in cell wall biosynthesis